MKALELLTNFVKSPKTTIAGIVGANSTTAVLFLAAPTLIFGQAGCDFSHVDWVQVAELFGASTTVGAIIGGVMKDRSGKPEDRGTTPPPAK